MNVQARIAKIEKQISKQRESIKQGVPLIELPPELKATWPKHLPYPLLGGSAFDSVQKDPK